MTTIMITKPQLIMGKFVNIEPVMKTPLGMRARFFFTIISKASTIFTCILSVVYSVHARPPLPPPPPPQSILSKEFPTFLIFFS